MKTFSIEIRIVDDNPGVPEIASRVMGVYRPDLYAPGEFTQKLILRALDGLIKAGFRKAEIGADAEPHITAD